MFQLHQYYPLRGSAINISKPLRLGVDSLYFINRLKDNSAELHDSVSALYTVALFLWARKHFRISKLQK